MRNEVALSNVMDLSIGAGPSTAAKDLFAGEERGGGAS